MNILNGCAVCFIIMTTCGATWQPMIHASHINTCFYGF